MILELDCGNSSLKWRLVNSGFHPEDVGRLELNSEDTASFFCDKRFASVRQMILASVVESSAISEICAYFEQILGAGNVFIASSEKEMCGVKFNYPDVSRLGVDRCLAMVAAYQYYPGGVLVIDCGSAITADLVDMRGWHLGGYILPGFDILQSSLESGTSKIRIDSELSVSIDPGDSTVSCVGNGVNLMVVAALERIRLIAEEKGLKHFCVTGGGVSHVSKLGLCQFDVKEDLVFKGLEMVCPF